MNEKNVAFLIHALSTGGAERIMSVYCSRL